MAVSLTPAVPDPASNLAMTLGEFDSELVARGYGGYGLEQRHRYINWGYFDVARLTRWYWEETSGVATIPPGEYIITLPGQFKSLELVSATTVENQRKLLPMSLHEFSDAWLPLDLTSSLNRSTMSHYILFRGQLLLLPPPEAQEEILVHYHRQPTPLVATTDRPITPAAVDEAIMQAALIRCAQRANDSSKYAAAVANRDEILLQEAGAQGQRSQEEDERVTPWTL